MLISRKNWRKILALPKDSQEAATMFFCGFICGAAIASKNFMAGIDQSVLKEAKEAFGNDIVFNATVRNFNTVVKLINEGHAESDPTVDNWMKQEAEKYQVSFEAFQILTYGCRYGAVPMVMAVHSNYSEQQAIDDVLKSLGICHYQDALARAVGDLAELTAKQNSS